MTSRCPRLAAVALLWSVAALGPTAQQPAPADATTHTYTVFLRSRPIGQEAVSVVRQDGGWLVRGSNRLGPPLDVVTRTAEIQYDGDWRPSRLLLEGTSRGRDVSLKTTFASAEAVSEITVAGSTTTETDAVTADALVLPNAFLGSYAALARRLVGQPHGTTFRGYIAPQGEVEMRLDATAAERIETPRAAIAATRYTLTVPNQPPAGDVQISLWADAEGNLLRLSVPAQALDLARDDVASAAARTTSFSIPGDETVLIPGPGFNLAASITKPAGATGRLPAVVLVGGPDTSDRDGAVAGIPVIGQIAADLAEAGFLVVRYDRRGIGQSGGRAETATLNDYAEDVRAIVQWLDKRRPDVDKRRIAVVGHGDGAWVAMRTAAREKRVKALVVAGAGAVPGAELVLEQQQSLLQRMNAPDAERDAKIALQKRINAAVLEGGEWEGVPDEVREAADTAWFQSYLAFDPARAMKDVRQPVLVVHGELDAEVPPSHAERLAEMARARRRNVPTDLVRVPGVNHLLVPAKTGTRDEYATLPDREVAGAATSAIADWLKKNLG